MQRSTLVPVQCVDGPYQSRAVLSAHLGTTDYLLAPSRKRALRPSTVVYTRNENVWGDIIHQRVSSGANITLKSFYVSDWFPRAPGLFHTPNARYAREEALRHLHPKMRVSPIRDHAGPSRSQRKPSDYTSVLTPTGKISMLQGGVGSIRLKPINLFGEPHWLMTASSDGVNHAGVPLAVPRRICASILAAIHESGAVCATVTGELEFLPDPFSRMFDASIMVPRLFLKVAQFERRRPRKVSLENSVAVSFVSDYQGRPDVYASYVTYQPDVENSFEEAISWMKTEYVEGEYRGRIITDFDQTRTIFPEARLALSKVMDRLISRGELTETIELMHARATVDSYFDEITRRGLLSDKCAADRTKVFISYARAAEENTHWVARIRTHLEGVVHSGQVEIWDDGRIEPGDRWREEIERALRSTRVAVLVLTADFLASKFIRDVELPTLLEAADAEGARVLCVYGSDVHLSGVSERLSRYQFVNRPERPLQALSKAGRESVYKNLSMAVERALAA